MARAAMVAGGLMAAVGMLSSAGQAKANAKSQQNAADYNAQVDIAQAHNALDTANLTEQQQRRGAAGQLGEMRGAIAESGLTNTGTVLDIYQQAAHNAEMDALNIRYGGILKSDSLQKQAAIDKYSGQVSGANASAATTAGYLNAGASLLSAYGSYAKAQPPTIPSSAAGGR